MESETPSPGLVNSSDEKSSEDLTKAGEHDGGKLAIDPKRRRVLEMLHALGELEPDATPAPSVQEVPDVEFAKLVRRIEGYCSGVFRNGLPCFLLVELIKRFAKRTGYSIKHTQDAARQWMKWTSKFTFRRQRLGRSTCVVIVPRVRRGEILTLSEIRRRLIGAIRNYVAKSGGVKVGRKFLENFHKRYGLPPEEILHAWETIRWIDGCRCQWQGRGRKRVLRVLPEPAALAASHKRQMGGRAKNLKTGNLPGLVAGLVSLPEIASGISPPSGGNDLKTAASPSRLPDKSSSSLRSQPGEGGEGSPFRYAEPWKTQPGAPAADFRIPSGTPRLGEIPRKPAEKDHGSYRWQPSAQPLRVCNRWISAAKLRAKANFLVFQPLLHAHAAAFRVRFRVQHALNFAEGALRAGFLDSEICAAYRSGLDTAQQMAARDFDAAANLDFWRAKERDRAAEFTREPSQAVSEAWKILRADSRSDEDRWETIFRGDARPAFACGAANRAADHVETGANDGVNSRVQGNAAESRKLGWRVVGPGLKLRAMEPEPRAPAPKPARTAATTAKKIEFGKDGAVIEYKEGPDLTPALSKASLKSPDTIEAHMQARGLTIDALLKLPRAAQQKFVREAFAAQRAGVSEKG